MPTTAPTMWAVTTTAPLIALLDRVWSAIRTEHPDVPPAVVSLGTSPADRGHLVTLSTARWSGGPDDADLPELAVTGTALDEDAETLLAAILHAAAHGVGESRGVATTSRQGRYHNARYADFAREVGISVEQTTAGWTDTGLAVGTSVRYATELRELREQLAQLPARREEPRAATVGRASNNNPVPARCGCSPSRRIRVAPSVMELGPITCGICQQAFTTD